MIKTKWFNDWLIILIWKTRLCLKNRPWVFPVSISRAPKHLTTFTRIVWTFWRQYVLVHQKPSSIKIHIATKLECKNWLLSAAEVCTLKVLPNEKKVFNCIYLVLWLLFIMLEDNFLLSILFTFSSVSVTNHAESSFCKEAARTHFVHFDYISLEKDHTNPRKQKAYSNTLKKHSRSDEDHLPTPFIAHREHSWSALKA